MGTLIADEIYQRSRIFDTAGAGLLVVGQSDVSLPWAYSSTSPYRENLFTMMPEGGGSAEALVITLIPPKNPAGSGPGFNGFQVQPFLDIYAVIRWGTLVDPAQIEVDFAQGVAFPVWASYVQVDAVNAQTAPQANAGVGSLPKWPVDPVSGLALPPEVGAFLSPGAYSFGTPKRTKQFFISGEVLNLSPLWNGATIDPGVGGANGLTDNPLNSEPYTGGPGTLTYVPAFAQSLQVLVTPTIAQMPGGAAPTPIYVGVIFFDIFGNQISQILTDSLNPTPILVPSDAYTICLGNPTCNAGGPSGGVIIGMRVVFTLAL